MAVQLKVLTLEDVPQLTDLVRAQAEHLRPWEPARPAHYYSIDKQTQYAATAIDAYQQESSVPFLIWSDEDELLGRVTLSGITRGALLSCAIGYWVRDDRADRGHATQAVAQAVDYAFSTLKLHRVQAETLPENVASQRVLARNGFRLFGVAPDYLRINGSWRDHLMFQRLNEDA